MSGSFLLLFEKTTETYYRKMNSKGSIALIPSQQMRERLLVELNYEGYSPYTQAPILPKSHLNMDKTKNLYFQDTQI